MLTVLRCCRTSTSLMSGIEGLTIQAAKLQDPLARRWMAPCTVGSCGTVRGKGMQSAWDVCSAAWCCTYVYGQVSEAFRSSSVSGYRFLILGDIAAALGKSMDLPGSIRIACDECTLSAWRCQRRPSVRRSMCKSPGVLRAVGGPRCQISRRRRLDLVLAAISSLGPGITGSLSCAVNLLRTI